MDKGQKYNGHFVLLAFFQVLFSPNPMESMGITFFRSHAFSQHFPTHDIILLSHSMAGIMISFDIPVSYLYQQCVQRWIGILKNLK
jgi:hypothetical protein